jgi:hypothetical protein
MPCCASFAPIVGPSCASLPPAMAPSSSACWPTEFPATTSTRSNWTGPERRAYSGFRSTSEWATPGCWCPAARRRLPWATRHSSPPSRSSRRAWATRGAWSPCSCEPTSSGRNAVAPFWKPTSPTFGCWTGARRSAPTCTGRSAGTTGPRSRRTGTGWATRTSSSRTRRPNWRGRSTATL